MNKLKTDRKVMLFPLKRPTVYLILTQKCIFGLHLLMEKNRQFHLRSTDLRTHLVHSFSSSWLLFTFFNIRGNKSENFFFMGLCVHFQKALSVSENGNKIHKSVVVAAIFWFSLSDCLFILFSLTICLYFLPCFSRSLSLSLSISFSLSLSLSFSLRKSSLSNIFSYFIVFCLILAWRQNWAPEPEKL